MPLRFGITAMEFRDVAGRVMLSKAVYGNPEAERRLASKISTQGIAGSLLGGACVSDAGAQITLAEKITDSFLMLYDTAYACEN